MIVPDIRAILAAGEATWPPARTIDLPGWQVRDGRGGGQRVSAATATTSAPNITAMEATQARLGQPPLVMVRPGERGLDKALDAAGYRVHDPVTIWLAPVGSLAKAPPPVTAFHVAWPPVRVQAELWDAGDIGAGRIAVMERVTGPKCAILGRSKDQPAGAAFIALSGEIAMLHALVVSPRLRRTGAARNMMRAAALWAEEQGANWLAVLVTEANGPANALYSSLGMEPAGSYHYRAK